MEILNSIFVAPFGEMFAYPDFLLQVVWEGFVAGVLYSLIALGFVLIYKASGVFNFAQGIMVVFAALVLVSLHEMGVPAWLAVILSLGVMGLLAISIERFVLRKLVNQHDAILLMATIGLTLVLKGVGQLLFGGEPKPMITEQLGLPTGSTDFAVFDGIVILQHIDIAATGIALLMVASLAIFFSKTRIGRALRAVADDHQAALSVGLEIIALKALAVLILGGFTSIPGAIVGGLIIGVGEKLFEVYWGALFGSGVEAWFAYVLALIFLLFRPQGLFGERIIERV